MRKRKLLWLIFLFFSLPVLIISGKRLSPRLNGSKQFESRNTFTAEGTHKLIFFDEESFYRGVSRAKAESQPFPYHVAGGIIPHHLFPGFIIADFFSRLQSQKPETIILVGPNHYERGDFKVLTSSFGWSTPFGVVQPNTSIINDLIAHFLAQVDEETLPQEFSVAGIMPFVKFYLPQAQVVPLILSSTMNKEDCAKLAGRLADYVNREIVIIAAVDFSHYLTSPETPEKDKITERAMKEFDYRKLLTLDNEYLDSPASIATLLMTMQDLGTVNFDILHHTNSGKLQKNDYIPTTSYYSIAFY